jgi:beta-xylosidase
LIGEPVALLSNTKEWQGPLIEGPEMVVHDGQYFLFYAGNSYAHASYAEGVARCAGPLGPCVDSAGPVLVSNAAAADPGHGFVFTVNDRWWIVYHAYPPGFVGLARPGRLVWLDPITWTVDGPVVQGPNAGPQEGPLPDLAG